MGRNREPDEVKARRGTLSPCRRSAAAPDGVQGCVKLSPPAWLDKPQRKMFKAAASVLSAWGILSPADAGIVAQYVVSLARLVEAEQHIKDEGVMVSKTVLTKKGEAIEITDVNSWYKISQDQQHLAIKLQQQLGFSPIARAKILSMIGKGEEEKDDFSEFEE